MLKAMRITIMAVSLILIGCKENNNIESLKTEQKSLTTNLIVNEIPYSEKSIDNLLKCGDYSYIDGCFTIADYGCIYQPNTINKLGNAEVYLVPKKELKENLDVEKEESKIGKMSIGDLKKFYDIYILIIDKKYLVHNINMDVPYYPNYPYKQAIYKYEDGIYKNTVILNISNEKDSQYNDWKTKFLNTSNRSKQKITSDLKGDYFIKTKVSSVETGDAIDVSFYFSFDVSKAILSIGTNNSLEAYCEGSYSVSANDNVLTLKYTGEGTCTSDEDESTFLIKKEDNQYYIKSKRFYDFKWQGLNKK
ncbi:hypothetical protein [Flavobacterium sp. CF136]|uniref:hypothetical protein n=1 Tax=Flavobacterium sp. (strain CF136) TaxID=1144313 RepID=UPI0002715B46|nr:hypothetical protein [Flavobacterium sp. CF136]EJL62012.1 hypothetical protein PMI10_03104 [Flavobacterium sp. CF136]